MKKAKSKQVSSSTVTFPGLVINAIEGRAKYAPQKNSCFMPAMIVLILWTLFSALGMQQVFQRIAQMQDIVKTIGESSEYFEQLKKVEEFSWSWKSEEKSKIVPFLKVIAVNILTMTIFVLYLWLMAYFAKSKRSWREAIVTTGACITPLTISMLVSYLLFKVADILSSVPYVPAILYLIGVILMIFAIMTAFIILFVGVAAILGIKYRRRYFTTTIAIFIVVATFAGASRLLM